MKDTRTDNKRTKFLAMSALIFASLLWGGGFIAAQNAINANFGAGFIMATRFTLATLIIGIFFRKEAFKVNKADLIRGVMAGALLFVSFLAQTVGLRFTTPSNNSLITAVYVILVPFASWILLRKRPKVRAFVLTALCLAGMIVLTYVPGSGISFNLGDILTLLCAVLFAVHIAYLDIVAKSIPLKPLLLLQMATAAVLSLIYFGIFEINTISQVDFSAGLLPVLYLGVVSTFLCYLLETYGQKHTSSSQAAILLSLEGVFGACFSVLFGFESATINMAIGGAIIILSVILSKEGEAHHE